MDEVGCKNGRSVFGGRGYVRCGLRGGGLTGFGSRRGCSLGRGRGPIDFFEGGVLDFKVARIVEDI